MTGNAELLNYIHQNAEMGKETLSQIVLIVEDMEFKKELTKQLSEYQKIYDETERIFAQAGKESKDISPFTKISSYIMINMKTLTDKSATHIAEMLMQGSNMGIIDVTKRLNAYDGANKDILKLAKDLLKTEQNNVEALKKFL